MNTLLKITSLVLAAAVPAALAGSVFGFRPSAPFDPLHLLYGLVASLTLLIASAEYQARATLSEKIFARQTASRRSGLPLAA